MLVLLFADSSWYKIPASKNHKKKTSTQDLLVWDLIKGYPPPQISCPGLIREFQDLQPQVAPNQQLTTT